MKKKELFNKLSPSIKFYFIVVFIISLNLKLKSKYKFSDYLILNYDKIFNKNQYWRLFTNIFVLGELSRKTIFFCYFFYIHFKNIEFRAIRLRKYAEYIMMIFYLLINLNIFNLFFVYIIKIKSFNTFAFQLLSSIIYINSKREPYKKVRIFMIKIDQIYFPVFQIIIHIIEGKSIIENLIGYVSGYLFLFLKEEFPKQKNINILKTPKFLVDLTEKYMEYNNKDKIKKNDNNQINTNNVNNNNIKK